VTPTPRSGIADRLAALLRRRPFVCQWCRRRFRVRTAGVVLRGQLAAERRVDAPARDEGTTDTTPDADDTTLASSGS